MIDGEQIAATVGQPVIVNERPTVRASVYRRVMDTEFLDSTDFTGRVAELLDYFEAGE